MPSGRELLLWIIVGNDAQLLDRHVSKALKALMKDVQADEEVGEDELEEMVRFPSARPPTQFIISHSSSKQKNNMRENI
jgi:hypothetical protein